MQPYALAFVLLWLWRYLRSLIHILSAWSLKPIQPAKNPRFSSKDVTVVLPTLGTDSDEFRRCISSIDACHPAAFIIVTPRPDVVRAACQGLGLHRLQILEAAKANKRLQMIQGLEHVETAVTVFADDDVLWPLPFLTYLLAPFEDHSVGAVGPTITLERPGKPNVWECLGAEYLERWQFGINATVNLDGGMQCLAGRTCAIFTPIIRDPTFADAFANERWFFNIPLSKADDDNFVTRWLVNHGWKIAVQTAPESVMTTVVESGPAFVGQCIRWHRTTWRSNITSMFVDKRIWVAQPWSAYALHVSTFNPPAAIFEAVLAYLLYHAYDGGQPSPTLLFPASTRAGAFTLLYAWLFFAKVVKMVPHFRRYPSDMRFLPAMVAFSYFHGLIKIYTLLTVHKTTWDGGHTRSLASWTDAASTVAAGARESGESILRRSDLKRIRSGTELKRLLVKSDSSG
ncbi:MAG: hypothetical protein L6R35_001420 [Caloplaca aegaea]|nr:MAG: hypothetical protein L6R35_001420 [Caloplaca aegaea]